MFEHFTESAIRTIMLAQEEARRLGHGAVGTEHILLGIIGQGGSKATEILAKKGITLDSARAETEKQIGRRNDITPVEVPFTDRAKRALEGSWEAARRQESGKISPDHLLLGVLSTDDSSGAKVLSALTDVSQLSAELQH